MRKLQYLFVMASAGLMLAACGNGGKQQTEAAEVNVKDTVVQAGETPAADVVVADLPEAGRGDLGGFDLRGPVKKCVWGETTVIFNEEGQLLKRDGQSLNQWFPGGVTRDGAGRLSECNADGFGSCFYTYDDRGLPTRIAEDGFDREFTYDDDGYVATEKQIIAPEMGDEEGEPEEIFYSYTILEKDAIGNWTKRKDQNGNEQTRTITYFE